MRSILVAAAMVLGGCGGAVESTGDDTSAVSGEPTPADEPDCATFCHCVDGVATATPTPPARCEYALLAACTTLAICP